MGSRGLGDRTRGGARLREFFAQGVETEYKGDVDLVTVADRTSEKLIRERLAAAFPEHGIYGEEGTRERLDGEFRWYVDPLDGTTNFAHGFPQFCVSLGLEQRPAGLADEADGTLVAAVIYDPMRDELFVAERGHGALLNGKPMRVSRTPELAEALLATGFPSRKRHASPNIHFYQEFTLRSHGVRRAGSAALDLAYVAAGRLDAFWEFNLNPWDTAAGILLVEEAGGQGNGVFRRAFPAGQPGDSGLERTDPRRAGGLLRGDVCRAESGADPHAAGVCGAPRRAEPGLVLRDEAPRIPASQNCRAQGSQPFGVLCYYQPRRPSYRSPERSEWHT